LFVIQVREYQRKRKEDRMREGYPGRRLPGEENGTVMMLTYEGKLQPVPPNYRQLDAPVPKVDGEEELPLVDDYLLEVNLQEDPSATATTTDDRKHQQKTSKS